MKISLTAWAETGYGQLTGTVKNWFGGGKFSFSCLSKITLKKHSVNYNVNNGEEKSSCAEILQTHNGQSTGTVEKWFGGGHFSSSYLSKIV